MTPWIWIVALLSLIAALAGTRLALAWLRRRAILDHPNARSSHDAPTPRGGGLAVTPVLLGAWTLLAPGPAVWALAALGLALGLMSWIDDLRGLSPAIRFPAQAAAVAAMIAAGALPGPVAGGLLPDWLDALVAGLAWLWFINLFNFMDGSDGITGVEAIVIGLGVLAVGALDPALSDLGGLGLAAAAAFAGFLVWNWHPARLFLGDVGSVPAGFALGWLLLALAARGAWAAALILPLYYLADATATLLRRAARGERVWRAHREHFYQRAIARGWSHARVARAVALCGALLVACAAWSTLAAPWAPLAVAAVAAGGLCAAFTRVGR